MLARLIKLALVALLVVVVVQAVPDIRRYLAIRRM